MRHLIAAVCASALVSLAAGAARAYDLALVIANGDYEHLSDVNGAEDAGPLRLQLRRAGFEVVSAVDATRAEAQKAAARFLSRAPEADRLLVVLNGRFLKSDRDWFLMPVGSREDEGRAALPRRSLPASVLMDALDDHPRERAVMVMGTGPERGEVSPYLERGLIDLSRDQGFVLIGGGAAVANRFAREVLAEPGASFGVMDARRLRLAISGLSDPPMTFIPGDRTLLDASEVDRQGGARGEDDAARAEREYWRLIRGLDSERAYAAYLDRFPHGSHAEQASRRLDSLRRDPQRRMRAGEDALDLGREDRRRVQTALSMLGFDPRGIDGVFGPGTRAALAEWQRAQGFDPTGYLKAEQAGRLSEQAGRRAAEIEAEAAAQRAEARRLDAAAWAETSRRGDAAGLRVYLERYPDGIFADRAHERLAALEREARGGAALSDASDWDEARESDRPRAYRRYIERNPDGAFVEAARARIAEIRGSRRDPERIEAARATERSLGLTPVTQGLIEGRLETFGFEPGTVDGRFDPDTRRAIRRYQRSRDLPPTGYLDQEAVVRILADSVLR